MPTRKSVKEKEVREASTFLLDEQEQERTVQNLDKYLAESNRFFHKILAIIGVPLVCLQLIIMWYGIERSEYKYTTALILTLLAMLMHVQDLRRYHSSKHNTIYSLILSIGVAGWLIGIICHHAYYRTWTRPDLLANIFLDIANTIYLSITALEYIEGDDWQSRIDSLRQTSYYNLKGA